MRRIAARHGRAASRASLTDEQRQMRIRQPFRHLAQTKRRIVVALEQPIKPRTPRVVRKQHRYQRPVRAEVPARSIVFTGNGPKWLEIETETTHFIVRWTQVDVVTLHDGTPRSNIFASISAIALASIS